VHLVGRVAHFDALLRKIGHVFGRAETAVVVGVHCACVRRERSLFATEKLVERGVEKLASDVPQADVDNSDTCHVEMPKRSLHVVVDVFPFEGVLTDQPRSHHLHLGDGDFGDPRYSPVMPWSVWTCMTVAAGLVFAPGVNTGIK
jgi:hypothetical protein